MTTDQYRNATTINHPDLPNLPPHLKNLRNFNETGQGLYQRIDWDANGPVVQKIIEARQEVIDRVNTEPSLSQLLKQTEPWSRQDREVWEAGLSNIVSEVVNDIPGLGIYRTNFNFPGTLRAQFHSYSLDDLAGDMKNNTLEQEYDCEQMTPVEGSILQFVEDKLLPETDPQDGYKFAGSYFETISKVDYKSQGLSAYDHAYIISSVTGNVIEATSDPDHNQTPYRKSQYEGYTFQNYVDGDMLITENGAKYARNLNTVQINAELTNIANIGKPSWAVARNPEPNKTVDTTKNNKKIAKTKDDIESLKEPESSSDKKVKDKTEKPAPDKTIAINGLDTYEFSSNASAHINLINKTDKAYILNTPHQTQTIETYGQTLLLTHTHDNQELKIKNNNDGQIVLQLDNKHHEKVTDQQADPNGNGYIVTIEGDNSSPRTITINGDIPATNIVFANKSDITAQGRLEHGLGTLTIENGHSLNTLLTPALSSNAADYTKDYIQQTIAKYDANNDGLSRAEAQSIKSKLIENGLWTKPLYQAFTEAAQGHNAQIELNQKTAALPITPPVLAV